MRDGTPLTLFTSFCGRPHRVADGLPLAHACRVLPPEALQAEADSNLATARHLFARRAAAGPLIEHAGVWKTRRR
jgi:hypothetical protein